MALAAACSSRSGSGAAYGSPTSAQIFGQAGLQIDQRLPLAELQRDLVGLAVGLGAADEVAQPQMQKLEQLGELGGLAGREPLGQLRRLQGVDRGLQVGVFAPIQLEVER